ncbi:MAG: tryptophan--tRNA ligase [Candidatus Aenigmarchaeota archaeon ex4484_52]|nr:MAG: tryptophan--tRNA ligase [Candidatus Aenigmarchaeota archaeon ex4484_52]
MQKFKVTPWNVEGDVDYNKLIKEFGVSKIDKNLLDRIKKHTGNIHLFLKRGVFIAHRDLDVVLDKYEKGEKFFLYTGRGPSGHTHLGHLIPWIFAKWIQDNFKVDLYFQLTDDEKFLFKENLTLKQANDFAYENALDVIALGFDPKKTFIFTNTQYAKTLYSLALEVAKKLNFSTTRAVFGFDNQTNVGQIFYTCMQTVPCFLPSVICRKNIYCLIPHGIDQDPHFRISRDVLPKLNYYKPASIQNIFFPGLLKGGKMSASNKNSAIYTTDKPDEIESKIKNAFSGGKETLKEHKLYGGNPDIDIAYQYLKFFFEPDDKKLQKIYNNYKSGKILTTELKQICIEKVKAFLFEHQKKRQEAKKKINEFILND